MRLWAIAERNVRQRFVTSALTVLSIMMGTGLVAFLWLAADQAEKRYNQSSRGFSAILGPKDGSPLEIVLSTVFHTTASAGVIPISVYRTVREDRRIYRKLGVRYAIPFVFGDNYRDYPLIGTTNEWFTEFARGKETVVVPESEGGGEREEPLHLQLAEGKTWDFSHEDLLAEAELQAAHLQQYDAGEEVELPVAPEAWKQVVLGAEVARRLELKIGDRIVPTHGFEDSFHPHPEGESEVIGILEATGAPIDRAIYAPAGLLYRMSGHRAIGKGQELVPQNVELSAVIVDMKSPIGAYRLRYEFQRRGDAQVAVPIVEINKLFQIVGNVTLALRAVSLLVLFTGALAIFISLYQTMFARQRDVAIMRSLGARRSQIFGIVLIEALLLSLMGALLGLFAAHSAAWGFSDLLLDRTGVPLEGFVFSWVDAALVGGVCLLGAIAGLLPALRTSMTDVARFLSQDR
jgi:putative ABC transport system permease protein